MTGAALAQIADNPPPPGLSVVQVPSTGGVALRAATAGPPAPCGSVLILPGRTEFIEKYFETMAALAARGLSSLCLDWRGQGLSDRLLPDRGRGHVVRFDDYLDDLDAAIAAAGPALPAPWTVLAHSMGGCIGVLWLAERSAGRIACAALSAPMIRVPTKPFPRIAARSLASAMAASGLGGAFVPGGGRVNEADLGFATNIVTGDEVRFGRNLALVAAEPRLALLQPTYGWVAAAFRAMDRALARAPQIKVPVLIADAGDERIVDPSGGAALAARLPAGRRIVIDGARHEILQERDPMRAAFWAAFDELLGGAGLQRATARRSAT